MTLYSNELRRWFDKFAFFQEIILLYSRFIDHVAKDILAIWNECITKICANNKHAKKAYIMQKTVEIRIPSLSWNWTLSTKYFSLSSFLPYSSSLVSSRAMIAHARIIENCSILQFIVQCRIIHNKTFDAFDGLLQRAHNYYISYRLRIYVN